MWKIDCRDKCESRDTHSDARAIIQVRQVGGLGQNGPSGSDDK